MVRGGSLGLCPDLRGVHEKWNCQNGRHALHLHLGHCCLGLGRCSSPHCPGSRLDRRPGPAATHFGIRRFENSGRWDRQNISRPAQPAYHCPTEWKRPIFAPSPTLRRIPFTQIIILKLALSPKDATRSRWLDIESARTLLLTSRPWRTKADRPPGVAPPPCQVPQSQRWCCRQHSSTLIDTLPSHPFWMHWRILPSSCATVSR